MNAARLLLASSSPTRQGLLGAAGLSVGSISPRLDEDALRSALVAEGTDPVDVAAVLAEGKALKISARHPESLVIGCDQILDLDGVCLAKPEDRAAARAQLITLRGHPHKLHAAAVIAQGGRPVWRHIATATLSVRSFSDAWLDAYLDRNWPAVSGSVGAYHLEGEGVQLFDRIDGDRFAILGLPLVQLLEYLRVRGEILA